MQDPLLKKLQHRDGVPVVALWAPDELSPAIDGWTNEGVVVHRRVRGNSPFVLAFFRSCAEIEQNAERLVAALGGDDPILWLAYPKKSSKRYSSDIGRDDSWQPIGDLGFEPVRQIAIDDDWSALRFRRAGNVKSLTRSRALSAEGKKRISKKMPDDPAVDSWLAARADSRRDTLQIIHRLVRETAPELAPSIQGKAIGYGPFHYIYKSGREGDAHRIALADNARYVSLYVLGADANGYLAEQHASRLGRASVGKSCIRFKDASDLHLDALRDLVRIAADRHQEVERS